MYHAYAHELSRLITLLLAKGDILSLILQLAVRSMFSLDLPLTPIRLCSYLIVDTV
jgi:hypothetical protein